MTEYYICRVWMASRDEGMSRLQNQLHTDGATATRQCNCIEIMEQAHRSSLTWCGLSTCGAHDQVTHVSGDRGGAVEAASPTALPTTTYPGGTHARAGTCEPLFWGGKDCTANEWVLNSITKDHQQHNFKTHNSNPQPESSHSAEIPGGSIASDWNFECDGGRLRCYNHGCDGQLFSSTENLRRHNRERDGTGRTTCEFCGILFTRKSNRDMHLAKNRCRGLAAMFEACGGYR
jgi:hypothetical protein